MAKKVSSVFEGTLAASSWPTESMVAGDLLDDYRSMLLIRRFEERASQLYGMGLIGGFCHLYIGQEAVPFREERDTMIVTQHHRFSPRTILQQRCSECGVGQIFQGAFRMNERCPVCGYKFELGPGYFTGAMYFSYALEIPIIAAGVILGKLLLAPTWPLHGILLAVWVAALPLTPPVFRYSLVLFIHFDRYFDPEGAGD